jgi:hypothetical protein
MMAKHFPTPTPVELQELFDLPDNGVSQCDLREIFEAQARIVKLRSSLQEARDELAGLMAHLETGLRLGLPVELGCLGVSIDPGGRVNVIRHEQEDPLGIDGLWF